MRYVDYLTSPREAAISYQGEVTVRVFVAGEIVLADNIDPTNAEEIVEEEIRQQITSALHQIDSTPEIDEPGIAVVSVENW